MREAGGAASRSLPFLALFMFGVCRGAAALRPTEDCKRFLACVALAPLWEGKQAFDSIRTGDSSLHAEEKTPTEAFSPRR